MIIQVPPGDLDQALRNNRNPGTTFALGEGVYTTQGAFAFESNDVCMLAPGCGIVGRGRDRTTIKAINVDTKMGGADTKYAEVLTGGARTKGVSDSLSMEGFTLDCTAIKVPVVGIHMWTSRGTVRDVAVTGIWGSRAWAGPVKEGFGVLINNAAGNTVHGGHIVSSVDVMASRGVAKNGYEPVENYVTAVYVGCEESVNTPLLFSEVRHVRVASDGPAHAGYGIGSNMVIVNCEAHGFTRAIFCDTGNSRDVMIGQFRAKNCSWALDLRTPEEGRVRERILVEDSKFVFKPGADWAQAVLLVSVPGSYISYVELRGCEFTAQGVLASKGRCNGSGVGFVSARSCSWLTTVNVPWQEPVIQNGALPWTES